MSNYETLVYEESGDKALLTLHRPPGNRINIQMIQELTKVCDTLEDHSKARTVVIRGAGGVFSEGVDFSEFHPDKPMDIHGFNKWEKICTRLERLPKATIALVDGAAVGGGFQLALVCDLRIATSRASFQLPEVHMGFLPGMATFRMAKYVGLGHAKRMMVTCEKVGPESALSLGIIDRVEDDPLTTKPTPTKKMQEKKKADGDAKPKAKKESAPKEEAVVEETPVEEEVAEETPAEEEAPQEDAPTEEEATDDDAAEEDAADDDGAEDDAAEDDSADAEAADEKAADDDADNEKQES